MYSFEWFVGEFFFTLSLMGCSLFVCAKTERRDKFLLRLCVGWAALIVLFFVWELIEALKISVLMIALKFTVEWAIATITIWQCFKLNIFGAMFCTTVGYSVQHITMQIYIMLNRNIMEFNDAAQYSIRLALLAISLAIIYFAMMKPRKFYGGEINPSRVSQTVITVMALIFPLFLNLFATSIVFRSGIDFLKDYICVISIVVSLIGIILEFYVVFNHQQERELEFTRQLMWADRRQYEEHRENVEMINIKCHDLRHQMLEYKNNVDPAMFDSALKLINIYDAEIDTGNAALNMVLHTHGLECENKHIELRCMADGKALSFMQDYDVYSLFGNAVENAVNAVESLPEDQRQIVIATSREDGDLVVRIDNPYAAKIMLGDGLPLSGKGEGHGFGMKSMRRTAEKYGGKLWVEFSDSLFSLFVRFPAGAGKNEADEK